MLRETLLGYLIDFLSEFECLASGVHLEIFHRGNLNSEIKTLDSSEIMSLF